MRATLQRQVSMEAIHDDLDVGRRAGRASVRVKKSGLLPSLTKRMSLPLKKLQRAAQTETADFVVNSVLNALSLLCDDQCGYSGEDHKELRRFLDVRLKALPARRVHHWVPSSPSTSDTCNPRRVAVFWVECPIEETELLQALLEFAVGVEIPDKNVAYERLRNTSDVHVMVVLRGGSCVSLSKTLSLHLSSCFQLFCLPPSAAPARPIEQAPVDRDEADLTILHFNDVYHISAMRTTDPVGGADRFKTLVSRLAKQGNHMDPAKSAREDARPIVMFSGDCFSPSIMSSVTRGSHMVPVLNELDVDIACFGNHDFDFGCEVAQELATRCNFPWLLSNVFLARSGSTLSGALVTKMLSWENGMKIGVMGLAEKGWIDTLPSVPEGGLIYKDFVEEGRRLGAKLRADGADMVVALTHMREPNDLILAAEVPELDLVLGGHDHFYRVTHVPVKGQERVTCPVIKSGCDFRELTHVHLFSCDRSPDLLPDASDVELHKGARFYCSDTRHQVNASLDQEPDMRALVAELAGEIETKMGRSLGVVECDLDGRFETVRTRESNMGNLVADVIRAHYQVDVALIVGGTLRSDDIHQAGNFTLRDLLTVLPFEDPCVVIDISGQQLWDALENSVSSVPKQDGRFPQLSGCRIVYDLHSEPGARLRHVWVGEDREVLDRERVYTMATRAYLRKGRDGFDMLVGTHMRVDEENGTLASELLRNYFSQVDVVNRMRAVSPRSASQQASSMWGKLRAMYQEEDGHIRINPQVEGRILTLDEYTDA